MVIAFQVAAMFLVPALILKFHQFKLTKMVGPIGVAYLLGLIVSVLVFLVDQYIVSFSLNQDVGEIGSFAAIAIAIPLLLFSANLKETRKLSKPVLLSFMSIIVSVSLVVSLIFFVYARHLEYGGILSAMSIGVYTGGTPNLNAIGNIFGLDRTIIAIANLSDMIIGAAFYMFLLLLSKPLLVKILKNKEDVAYLKETSNIENTEEIHLADLRKSKNLPKMVLLSLGMAVVSAGVGLLLWILDGSVEGTMIDKLVPSLLIGVTILGIIASFHPTIRNTKGTNTVGQYLILVFSFALASALDLTQLHNNFSSILLLYTIITILVLVVHVIFSKILKLNADVTIITLTAGIYGPAFIPAMTKQLKQEQLTVPGLICGSVGYAIGTFLGLLLGTLYLLF